MGDKSKIEWCDATWNPIVGCSRVSAGCENCYAEKVAYRFKHITKFENVVCEDKPKWNNSVFFDDKALEMPLRWKKPRRIFVCSMGDLFHKNVPDEWIDKVFAIMARCPQHTFMVLTKRPERMRKYVQSCDEYNKSDFISELAKGCLYEWHKNGRKNLWLGVSVEDQDSAVDRIPYLLDTPAAVRFISAEPLLGPIDLTKIEDRNFRHFPNSINALEGSIWLSGSCGESSRTITCAKLHWVIVGGESGKNARPMHPDWVRNLRDQCQASNTPFFFKQWGKYAPNWDTGNYFNDGDLWGPTCGGGYIAGFGERKTGIHMSPMLKSASGNTIDRKQHLEFPKIGGA